jgi:hypothetical protein
MDEKTYKLEEVTKKQCLIKEYTGKDHEILAVINYFNKHWYIANSSNFSPQMQFPERKHFSDTQAAFDFVVSVRKAYLSEIQRKPLTEAANAFIVTQARSLRERSEAAINQLYSLQLEKWQLLQLARECGVEEATWHIDSSDLGLAVNELLTLEHKGKPFFSEACLYDLLGKDAARTLLAKIKSLIKIVAPHQSLEL